jgi:hypothetical protein
MSTTTRPVDQSEVVLHAGGGITMAGRDAVNLYRAITLRQALAMYAKTGMLMTRGATPTVILKLASEYTGKAYKRGQHLQAAADVQVWIDTMKAAMPVTDKREA